MGIDSGVVHDGAVSRDGTVSCRVATLEATLVHRPCPNGVPRMRALAIR